ncbi:WD repeat-containing protein 75 [Chelonus insularis]|uniref:WD repeat-containing protein 75 n=1 Tax=Chelonus insularis TaxID=460826 RepID=UPI00158E98DA|nr:WD repeat-containing protein 75 [Chelonus insularis]
MHDKSTKNLTKDVKTIGEVDNLVVKRIGGGSIIDHRPLFSTDGEILYVVWKQVIRAYSTRTGDFVREFEPTDNKIAGIVFHPDNSDHIVGCTETGHLVYWNSENGLIIKNLDLQIHPVDKIRSFHIIHYKNYKGKNIRQTLISFNIKANKTIQLILFDIDTGENIKSTCIEQISPNYHIDIIGNHGDNLIALVQDVDLHIFSPARNLFNKIHKIGFGGRKFTCVTGHPEEECVATGDSSGRVAVWKNLFHNHPVYGSYHWHTLPVTEIAFSRSGGQMYTGGNECVLVKWVLANPHNKSFLPRLPAPIKYLTLAPDNLYVAVSTLDNGIIVVDPQKKLTAVIQNFTWGVSTAQKDLFPAGLTLDPRTGSLVLNSRTGHVQFFDVRTKSLLYNIHITAQNLLTQVPNAVIVNTEVTKIALNNDGSWMATVEERDDKISSPEIRLKYWKFDAKNQKFTLNTAIELPHDVGVNALVFQPTVTLDGEHPLAVTVGKDKKFKVWNLAETNSIEQPVKHWQCYALGMYRDLPACDAGFSIDGSILGVSFGSSLTIWTAETINLKNSLTHSRYSQNITRVEFGKHEICHLVVVASSEHIAVWNLLTLNMTWSVPLKLSTLTADPNSTYMAAFTTNNTLFIFTPQSSKPVYIRKNILDAGSVVLAASFVPNIQEKRISESKNWLRKSQLFFLDSNQELLTLEPESETSVLLENLTTSGSLPATAFSSMISVKTITNVERKTSFFHEQFNAAKKSVVEELLTVSAHTLPPMRMLCGPFILSLRAQNVPKAKVQEEKLSSPINEIQHSEDDSDDEDKSPPLFKNVLEDEVQETKEDDENEMNPNLVSYDWNFLASVIPTIEIS